MKKNDQGLSLLEVLIAIFIVVVAVGALASLYPGIFRGITQDAQSLKAWEINQNEMENLKNTDFSTLLENAYIPEVENPKPVIFQQDKNVLGVYYVERMLYEDNSVISDLAKINVVVCYKSGNTIVGEAQVGSDEKLVAGDDINGDGKITSDIQLTTLIMQQ